MDDVVYFRDKDLQKRWRCSAMKLYRLRQDGKLNSIQIGGCGFWLTSDAEIARIEAPPDIRKPAPSVDAEGSGRKASAGNQSNPTDTESPPVAQALTNGGAHG